MTLAFLLASGILGRAADPDVIINGESRRIPGGRYGTIFVKNDGILVVDGDVAATEVRLRWGSITCFGGLRTAGLFLEAGSSVFMTVNGNTNSADEMVVEGGTLNLCGSWSAQNVTVASDSTLKVIPFDSASPGSGTLRLACSNITVAVDAVIRVDVAGYDSRGRGSGSWPAGGYGGRGGKSFWGDSVGGGTYGDAFTPAVEMGGPGGTLGGGSITIEACQTAAIGGRILANGGSIRGGSSGGGVLLSAAHLIVTGMIEAKGGAGGDSEYYGGGGGGRIKCFYVTGLSTNDLLRFNVSGGAAGWRAVPGGAGTIWINAIPAARS